MTIYLTLVTPELGNERCKTKHRMSLCAVWLTFQTANEEIEQETYWAKHECEEEDGGHEQ